MTRIDPAAIDLPPTQPIDMTALMDQIRLETDGRSADRLLPSPAC
jgi:hypothetical protein